MANKPNKESANAGSNKNEVPKYSYELLLLNVETNRARELFDDPAPSHLGIGIIVTTQANGGPSALVEAQHQAEIAKATLNAHMEHLLVEQRLIPWSTSEVSVLACAIEIPSWLQEIVDASERRIFIAFYDADSEFTAERLPDLMGAMAHVSFAVAESGFLDITPSSLASFSEEFASAYEASVSDLFDSEQAVWCRDLVKLRYILRVGIDASLRGKSMLEAMKQAEKQIWIPSDLWEGEGIRNS